MMVGTSLDGIDAALVEFDSSGIPNVIEFETWPFTEVEPARVRAIASGQATSAEELSGLGAALARDHARAVIGLDGERTASLIGVHGVTVSHVPSADPGHGWQLLSGAALAALCGRDVACDFRATDIALGGQGAPLAPVADLALRCREGEHRIILNLGGISNFTALPSGARTSAELIAGDAGPANLVLDGFMRRISSGQQQYDDGGELGLAGTPASSVVEEMLADPWFERPLPRSGGREEFGDAWLDRFENVARGLATDADRMASLVAICARAIADQFSRFEGRWKPLDRTRVLVTGGGRKNRAVMNTLAELLPDYRVEAIEAIGEDGDAKEAVDFAWLARQRRSNTPLDLAPLTGASRNAVAGALYLAPEQPA